ncbi:MAG: flagellar hook-basal body complex protein FliE [Candidatus Eremiobacteraeota bacterium]|nr:flagellar hook-basal body complex protein FliE [Candidatus Eremiobacteraeota bacterium]
MTPVAPVEAIAAPRLPGLDAGQNNGAGFGVALGGALDALSGSLSRADRSAAALAFDRGSIADAAIARAKADVALEVAAVAASRISGALNTLMQTQV